jgi:hypothetical protein
MTKCVVNPCNATTCIHNKERQCQLDKIIITKKGECGQFREYEGKASYTFPKKDLKMGWKNELSKPRGAFTDGE